MSEFVPASAEALARLHAREALGAIVEVMRSPASAPQDRLRAAAMLLDRGHGKPTQAVVTVPANRANAAKLAGMSTAALLAIVQRAQGEGGIPQNEGPNGGASSEGYPLRGTCEGQEVDGEGVYPQNEGPNGGDQREGYPEGQRDTRLEQTVGSPRPHSRFETDDMIDVPSEGGIPQNEGPKARRSTKGTPIGQAAIPTDPDASGTAEEDEEEGNPWD